MAEINSLMITQPVDYSLTEDYKVFIDSLVELFKTTGEYRYVTVNPEESYVHRFDLTQFLIKNSIPIEDHYLIMRMNGITSVHEIDENRTSFIIPDQLLLSRMKQIYRTKLEN